MKISWFHRIEQASKSKYFTEEDCILSQLWVTDPISEFSEAIKLKENDLKYGPTDLYLILDGIFFTKAVEEDDIGLAIACYKSIVERVKKLNLENMK